MNLFTCSPVAHAAAAPEAIIDNPQLAGTMKLATIKPDRPADKWEAKDGRLVLVDDRAGRVLPVPKDIAGSLFEAMQDWDATEAKLRALDEQFKAGDVTGMLPLEQVEFMAPLPRTTCWIDGSAYIQHIVLVRKARNAEPPETLKTVPLMYQGVADPLYGPHEPIRVADESYGIDFEAEVGVILDEVPMGTKAEDALQYVKLLCVMNDVSLRGLIPAELKAGFGFFHGKPPTHFAPYAVTPDEIGDAWKDGRIHLKMQSWRNDEFHGDPDAGPEMFFGFHELIAHAAKTRPLPAGTILGSGTVSNEDTSRGASCIAETRMLETIHEGKPTTPFMSFGERVKIDVQQDGRSVFGVIDHVVEKYDGPGA